MVKNLPATAGRWERYGFDLWVRGGQSNTLSILAWRIPTEKRSLAGYSPWGHKESDITE